MNNGRLRTLATLLSLAILTGCLQEGHLHVIDLRDDTILPPEELQVREHHSPLEYAVAQLVYVNFDGVTVSDCPDQLYCSDAPNNRSRIISSHFGETSINFGAYTNAAGRRLVMEELKKAFRPYNVRFTTERPTQPPYTMLVVAPNPGPALGVAPLDCGNNFLNDIAFVYRANEFPAQMIASAAVHELGHAVGLTHVQNDEDYMFWTIDNRLRRWTRSLFDAQNTSHKCMDGDIQDAHEMLLETLGPLPEPECGRLNRLAGPNRHATAAAISRHLYPDGAPAVVLAQSGDPNPDALAAGPLARQLGAPLLLTPRDALANEARQEIQRLGAQEVVLIGGTGVLSTQIETELTALGVQWRRIAGANRFETAANVASEVGAAQGLAFIASGDNQNLVDALAASGPAAALGAPILLVPRQGALPAATAQALQQLQIQRTIVVGGEGAISAEIFAQLPNPQRVAGASRFDTAEAVALFARDEGLPTNHIFIARADTMPDALAAGAAGEILLLTHRDFLTAVTQGFIEEHVDEVTLLGGEGALGPDVARDACFGLY